MNITKETVAYKMEFLFESYEKSLVYEQYRESQVKKYWEMIGVIYAFYQLDLVDEGTLFKLRDRAKDIFNKLASKE